MRISHHASLYAGTSFSSGLYIRLGKQCSGFSPKDKKAEKQKYGGTRDSGAGTGWGWEVGLGLASQTQNQGNKVTEREKGEITPHTPQTLSSQSVASSLMSESESGRRTYRPLEGPQLSRAGTQSRTSVLGRAVRGLEARPQEEMH